MTKDQVCEQIRSVGVIPAIRVNTAVNAVFAVEAVASGGIPIVEITMTVRDALDVITELVGSESGLIVGAGTVLDAKQAEQCIAAGASFITSPSLDEDVVREAQRSGVAMIPGAMTPTEVHAAEVMGCDFVKVFPCAQIGGPQYIRALRHPFPRIPLIASGGVNQQTASEYIRCGADVLGIGTGLVTPDALDHQEAKRIRELARRYLAIVRKTREELAENSATLKNATLK